MNKAEIKKLVESWGAKGERTILIVDYGNVEKWKNSLRWKVGIKKLAQLAKYFVHGVNSVSRRRFYYGADFGRSEKSEELVAWSKSKIETAGWNRFEVVTKRVKYIHSKQNTSGFEKKCDLDIEMAIDLIKMQDQYDNIILFSGDGDLMYAIKFLKEEYNKNCIVFGVRDHIGREVFDAETSGIVDKILFVEDFEYRLKDPY